MSSSSVRDARTTSCSRPNAVSRRLQRQSTWCVSVRASCVRAAPQGAALRDGNKSDRLDMLRRDRDGSRTDARGGAGPHRRARAGPRQATRSCICGSRCRPPSSRSCRSSSRSAGRIERMAISIQTRPPVALTRHIRTVSSDDVVWPPRPQVLFVAGDPDNIPFLKHRAALVAAIQPFQYSESRRGHERGHRRAPAVRRSADHSRRPDARRTAARARRPTA